MRLGLLRRVEHQNAVRADRGRGGGEGRVGVRVRGRGRVRVRGSA